MSEATELDKTRRYLVPVARLQLPNEPDLVHLSVYEYFPRWEDWATGMALCGLSTEQGALPPDTLVTCPDCRGYRPTYQAALDRQASRSMRPDAQTVLLTQVQAAVKGSGLKQRWMADQMSVSDKHLSQLLTGRVPLTLEWAERILDLCGLELSVTVRPRSGGGR